MADKKTLHSFGLNVIKAMQLSQPDQKVEIDKITKEAKIHNIDPNQLGNYVMQNHAALVKEMNAEADRRLQEEAARIARQAGPHGRINGNTPAY